MRSGGTAE
jgi:hypothetical protein